MLGRANTFFLSTLKTKKLNALLTKGSSLLLSTARATDRDYKQVSWESSKLVSSLVKKQPLSTSALVSASDRLGKKNKTRRINMLRRKIN